MCNKIVAEWPISHHRSGGTTLKHELFDTCMTQALGGRAKSLHTNDVRCKTPSIVLEDHEIVTI